MFKTIACLLLALVILVAGFCLYSEWNRPKPVAVAYCPFCDPKVLEEQGFYEDELVAALLPKKPVYPGHSLVIPKRHVERYDQLSQEEVDRMMATLKKVDVAAQEVFDISPYLLLQKNGYEVGQSVFHVHFHFIPRKAGDDSIFALVFRILTAHFRKQIPEVEYHKMRKEMHLAITQE